MSRQAKFTISLNQAAGATCSVDYTTVPGTAVEREDFLPTSGTVTFAPGETSKDIFVTVRDNDQPDAEQFEVVLSNPVGMTLADAIGECVLPAGAPPPPPPGLQLNVADGVVSEIFVMDLVARWDATDGFKLNWMPVSETDFSKLGPAIPVAVVLAVLQEPQAAPYTMSWKSSSSQNWFGNEQQLAIGTLNDFTEGGPQYSPTLIPADLTDMTLTVLNMDGGSPGYGGYAGLGGVISLPRDSWGWSDNMSWRVTIELDANGTAVGGDAVRLNDPQALPAGLVFWDTFTSGAPMPLAAHTPDLGGNWVPSVIADHWLTPGMAQDFMVFNNTLTGTEAAMEPSGLSVGTDWTATIKGTIVSFTDGDVLNLFVGYAPGGEPVARLEVTLPYFNGEPIPNTLQLALELVGLDADGNPYTDVGLQARVGYVAGDPFEVSMEATAEQVLVKWSGGTLIAGTYSTPNARGGAIGLQLHSPNGAGYFIDEFMVSVPPPLL